MKQKKGRTQNLSRFCGTKPVIFKPAISDSNEVEIDPKLGDLILCLGPFNVLSWFEYWLSKTSDLRDTLSARLLPFQNTTVLVEELFGWSNGVCLS